MRLSFALPRRMHARDLAATCLALSSALASSASAFIAASAARCSGVLSSPASSKAPAVAVAFAAFSFNSSSFSSSASFRRSSLSPGEGSSRNTMLAPAAPPRTKYRRPFSSRASGRDRRYTDRSAAFPHHSINDSAQSGFAD